MKRLLNTLFITRDDTYLAKDGNSVCVRQGGKELLRVPLIGLNSILCFGYAIGCSPALMHACAEADVSIGFCSPSGRFLATVSGPTSGNVRLRVAQYEAARDPIYTGHIASHLVQAKLVNSRNVLLRFAREHQNTAKSLIPAAEHLQHLLKDVTQTSNVDRLRGLEGDAASFYFGQMPLMLLNSRFTFSARSRRPPKDPVNALLSFVYTLLANDVRSALESVGLDPQHGFLHADRPGRPGLALDLMEEFRSWLADRFVLTLINRRQAKPGDFTTSVTGSCSMKPALRKRVLVAWQERKQTSITHPFIQETIPIGLFAFIQAHLLARHLRGDLDNYPPFIWK